jgi:pimeloyl-ACP methyl ester carboxylesterase
MEPMEPDAITWVRTGRWAVPLRRYVGRGPPVLLVHGLGANHRNWDAFPDISLADHLQRAGWDVWVLVLPGDAAAVPMGDGPPVTVDALVTVHLPDLVRAVQAASGTSTWYGVGHSLGGMLLLASLDLSPAAVVTVASAAVFRSPSWVARTGARLGGAGGADAARRWAWSAGFNPVVPLLARRRHVDAEMLRWLARIAVDDGSPAVGQTVRGWIRSGEMTDGAGRPLLDGTATTPVLLLGGDRDRLVDVADVRRTAERLPGGRFEGLPGYGHLDPVLGRTARTEVYPRIAAFLAARGSGDQPGS